MRRFLPHLWAAAGLFTALVTCSCQHHRCCCGSSNCQTPAASPLMAPPLASAARLPPAVAAPAPAKAANLPAAAPTNPVFHTTAKLNPANPEPTPDVPPSLDSPNESAQIQTPERFGHDANYRWLVGTLEYSQIQRGWLLRYMSYEEDDRYGGCVTLVGPMPSASLKKGQTVRVEGSLIDPESRQLRPAFQVENMRASGS